ncbi:MAG: hypothetical protein COU81_02175 [Candidatus Portnoybacteria bacterium CG10_big_fil_rev_8_21_14_0_10_36_7]|uniref:Glycosyltransferase n=1 Tax=Candidatus Portnoybacteria bacterium CG10_big_fil_rev_8_21_14_0_10_36_7 TaxID=1974812 RepID=A0A2M8KE59_9BACT|nr:MAG: hypothetical protein COU81_02175 [Candidatus Portnoybacteria bacterium CG10_big_fil_rev_8_21_14_0_10_36_7]
MIDAEKKMNILIPILHYPPVIGGFEIFAKNISECIANKHNVFVLTGKVAGQPDMEIKGNLIVRRVGLRRLNDLSQSSVFYIVTTLAAIFCSAFMMAFRKKVNIIHCQGFFSGLIGLKIKWLTGIKYIITIQSADYSTYHPSFSQKWLVKIKMFLERIVYKQAAVRHAVSNALVEYYAEFGFKDGIMIPNGVESDIFKSAKDKKLLRKELDLDTDNLLICVSRLEHKNGTHDLIKAALSIKKEVTNFKLLIIGGGSQRKELETMRDSMGLGREIIFLGDVLHSDLPKYLSVADIFVRPALAEGFGIVFLEAMASEVAVVGTPVGGIVDFIKDGETGLFCKPNNPQSIANALIKLIKDKKLYDNVVRGGIELLKNKYNWDAISEKMEKIYRLAIRRKVLIISGIFPPDIGGPATILESLSKDLVANGFTIGILTFGEKTELDNYSFSVYRVSRNWWGPIKSVVFLFEAFFRVPNYDLIYLQDLYLPGLAGFLSAKFWSKKVVSRFVGDWAWENASLNKVITDDLLTFQSKKYSMAIELRKKIRRRVLVGANVVIVASNFLKEVAMKIGVKGDKVQVIYNSVDFMDREISSLSSKSDLRKNLALGGLIIVSAGRLAPWKGMEVLIRAFSGIHKKISETILVILGDGIEYNRLNKLVEELQLSDCVKLIGRVPRELMLQYLKSADIFALNTNYEGMSHTILEAMKFGLPIVTTNAGGNPETVQDGVSGVLVDYNDVGAFERAFSNLLEDKNILERMSEASFAHSVNYKWSNVIEKTTKIFNNL